MNKEELRKYYLEKRASLSNAECHQMSQRITELVLPLIPKKSKVSLFLPIKKFNEINTWFIVHALENTTLVVSKSNFSTHTMQHYIYEGNEQLEENKWGIPEPKYGTEVAAEAIDIVLVPMLIGDKNGHRVGYGKGFYDRFLANCRADTIKIGLCFFEPIEKITGTLKSDIALDYYVSPKKVYHFK